MTKYILITTKRSHASYLFNVALLERVVHRKLDVGNFFLDIVDGRQTESTEHHRFTPFLKLAVRELVIGDKLKTVNTLSCAMSADKHLLALYRPVTRY